MTLTKRQIEQLPPFISTALLGRITNRSQPYVEKRIRDNVLPPRRNITGVTKGWPKREIIKWLKQHPEVFKHG